MEQAVQRQLQAEYEASAARRFLGVQAPVEQQHPGTVLDSMLPPVSTAVVQGTQLAVIPTHPNVDERDALASIATSTQIKQARVLFVASDLPLQHVSAADWPGQ
jgi:hypothetical protein